MRSTHALREFCRDNEQTYRDRDNDALYTSKSGIMNKHTVKHTMPLVPTGTAWLHGAYWYCSIVSAELYQRLTCLIVYFIISSSESESESVLLPCGR